MFEKDIGKQLLTLILAQRRQGETRIEFAERINQPVNLIHSMQRGHIPNFCKLVKICELLNIRACFSVCNEKEN